jgi:hypothetical protein
MVFEEEITEFVPLEESETGDLESWMEALEMLRLEIQALSARKRELEAYVLSELSRRNIKQYTLGRGRLRAVVTSRLVPVDIEKFAEAFPHLVRTKIEPDQRAISSHLQMPGGELIRQYLKEEVSLVLKTDDRKSIPSGQEQ